MVNISKIIDSTVISFGYKIVMHAVRKFIPSFVCTLIRSLIIVHNMTAIGLILRRSRVTADSGSRTCECETRITGVLGLSAETVVVKGPSSGI